MFSKLGVPYTSAKLQAGSSTQVSVGATTLAGFDAAALQNALRTASYPASADPGRMNKVMVVICLTAMIVLASMIYGPLAAALVEMFPTRIRYTALSVPYHAAVGWFGGLLPAIAYSLVVATGNVYYGLRFPVLVVSISFLIGMCFMRETNGRDLHAD